MEKVRCTHCQEDNKTNAKYCMYCGYELPKFQQEVLTSSENIAEKKKLPTKKWVGIAVGIVAFIIMYFVAQGVFENLFSFDKAMMKAASELNEVCPMMVDADTRLDNAVALPPNSLQYNYTLVNLVKSDINIEEFRTYMLPQLINITKTNPDMSAFRKNRVTMIYVYKDKQGEHVTKFAISPEEYGEHSGAVL
jgi:hypothetical protein